MDNGPEMTAHALADWCTLSQTGTVFIDPGAPWQNPFVKSFHSRMRDELLNLEEFYSLAEARVVISYWRQDYNTRRPHSSLGMRAPTAFAAEWTAADPTRWRHDRPGAERRAADYNRCGYLSATGATFSPVTSTTHSHSWWTDKRGPVNELLATAVAARATPMDNAMCCRGGAGFGTQR